MNTNALKLSKKLSLTNYELEDLLECLPQNRPIYKDSGLWQVRTDDMENIYMNQNSNESFKDFLIRYILFVDEYEPEYNIFAEIPFRV